MAFVLVNEGIGDGIRRFIDGRLRDPPDVIVGTLNDVFDLVVGVLGGNSDPLFGVGQRDLGADEAVFACGIHMDGGVFGVCMARQELVLVRLDSGCARNGGTVGIDLGLVESYLDIANRKGVLDLIGRGQVRHGAEHRRHNEDDGAQCHEHGLFCCFHFRKPPL